MRRHPYAFTMSGQVADDRVAVAGHFIVKAGAIDAVLVLWTELVEHVRAYEPGTELYLLEQDEADASKLWLNEVYKDEAAFVAHGHSPVIRGLTERLRPLIAERHLARTRKVVGVHRLPKVLVTDEARDRSATTMTSSVAGYRPRELARPVSAMRSRSVSGMGSGLHAWNCPLRPVWCVVSPGRHCLTRSDLRMIGLA